MKQFLTLFLFLFMIPVAGRGQLSLSGNSNSYTLSDNVYTITGTDAITVTGSTEAERIVIKEGITANLTFQNVSIKITNEAPVSVSANATLNLMLSGNNILDQTAWEKSGLNVPENATLNINASSVNDKLEATGRSGIGGNVWQKSGTIVINNGTVHATAKRFAAGIGGGSSANGSVKITGGVVIAKGHSGAGIGGGWAGDGGTVEITGGFVYAQGYGDAADIGNGGRQGDGYSGPGSAATVTISGGVVIANSINNSPSISGSNYLVVQGKTGEVHGSISLEGEVIFPSGITVTVPSGASLTVAQNAVLTNEGTIVVANGGTFTNNGTILNTGTLPAGTGGTIKTKLTADKIESVTGGTYTGSEITPTVKFKDDAGVTDSDYELSYDVNADRTNAGKNIKVFITPKGNYFGDRVEKTFDIGKATPEAAHFQYNAPSGLTYDGNAKVAAITANNVTGMGSVALKYYKDGSSSALDEAKDVGAYVVKINLGEGQNYTAANGLTNASDWVFTITQAVNEWTESLSLTGWTYNETAQTPVAKAKFGNPVFTYSGETDGTYVATQPADAGTWYVKAAVEETGNYQGLASGPVSFTINRASATLSFAEGAKTIQVGEMLTNVVTVNPENLPVVYSSSDPSVATVDASTGAVTGVSSGEVTVTATLADKNYTDTSTGYQLKVEQKEVTPPPYVPSYYDLVFEPNDSVLFSARATTVEEGYSVTFAAEAAKGFDPATLVVEYRRGRRGSWESLGPAADGSFRIGMVYDDIYVRASVKRLEDPTAIDRLVDGSAQIRVIGSELCIALVRPSDVRIVSIEGRVVRMQSLPAGDNRITGLPEGVYIVVLDDGTRAKVVIR